MKVSLKKGKKLIVLKSASNEFGIQLPETDGPLFVEAEFDERSPMQIMIPGRESIPVKKLQLSHTGTYVVKSFKRHTKAGVVVVAEHHRHKPVRLKGKSI